MYMAPGQGSIALEGVTRRFRIEAERAITALSGVDLEIEQGAAVALSGPSGSGKSTLLHLIGALERPDEGTVTVGGSELGGLSRRELAAHRRRVGFVFQRFNLLPALTVVDNVMAPVLPYRVDFDKEARARELLAAVGLEGRETSLPSRLSGGQQQRVAIARALINRPPVVLADEPTGNLDSRTGAGIVDLLLSLRADHGITIVLATHDSQVAARCDRVVRLLDRRMTDDVDVRGRRRRRDARPARPDGARLAAGQHARARGCKRGRGRPLGEPVVERLARDEHAVVERRPEHPDDLDRVRVGGQVAGGDRALDRLRGSREPLVPEAPQRLGGALAAAGGVHERLERRAQPWLSVEGGDAGGERAQVGLQRAGGHQHELMLAELVEQQRYELLGVRPRLAHGAGRDAGALRDALDGERVIAVLDQLVLRRRDDGRAGIHAPEDTSYAASGMAPAPVASSIAAAVIATSRVRSPSEIDSGGISTTTSPSGRTIAPRRRAASVT